jgi:hypothetical protein
MIGCRSVGHLVLLNTFLICAFAAQSASAAPAQNTTAFTCVKGGGAKDFADEHCDQNVGAEKGEYGHVAIAVGKETEVELTNKNVTNSTKDKEPAVLKSKVGLTSTEITCQSASGQGTFKNEEPVNKQHGGSGSGSTNFTECTVNKPAKCTVKQPISVKVKGVPVEKLGAGANEMGGEVKGSGEGETFTEITFEGEECSLKGKTFKVSGSAIVTSGPTTESSQTGKSTGATAVYTPKKEMQKLKVGAEVAEVSLITTVRAVAGNPLSGTTVT